MLVSIEEVVTAVATNELACEVDAFVHNQAFAIATAVAMFSPQAIILGGGVCDMPGFPKEHLSTLIEANFPFAQTGRDGSTLGQAWLAERALRRSPCSTRASSSARSKHRGRSVT